MVTAPTTRPPSVATSVNSGVRSTRFGQRGTEKRPHMSRDVLPKDFIEEEFDHSVNPWQHLPPTTSTRNNNSSEDSIENNGLRPSNVLRLPSPMYNRIQQQQRSLTSPSPPPYPQHLQSMTSIYKQQQQQNAYSSVPGSSASSSVTATPRLNHTVSNRNLYTPTTTDSRPVSQLRYLDPNQPYTSVALGPATKRALESLQNEIIALNERIDDLRKELVERDRQRAIRKKSDTEEGEETESDTEDIGDGWKWVIKASIYFFLFFFFFY